VKVLYIAIFSPAFKVDAVNGQVSVRNPREVPSQAVQLVVVATDKGTPPRNSTTYIHVSKGAKIIIYRPLSKGCSLFE